MLEVRPASEDDDAALRALDRETWSPNVSPAPQPSPSEPFFDERLRPRDVLVATVEGDLAGWIAFGPALPLAASRHQLRINGLAVDPARRREGIAAALIEALAERARGAGIRRLTLRVLSTNAPARALYEQLGFEVEGVLREAFRLEEAYVDNVLMGLDLTGRGRAPDRAATTQDRPRRRNPRPGLPIWDAERVDATRSERKQHALDMFGRLPAHYDELGTLLSFGQDPRWRHAAVAAVRAAPEDRVLNVACGTGLVARALIRRWGCRVVGLDQSAPMLDRAGRAGAADPRLGDRLELVEGEAERLPFADAEFDHLTFTYLLRYVDDPAATLRELARVVKPGGRVASLEFCVPRGIWLSAWRLYTRVGLPLLGRLDSSGWYAAGRFLGPSIEGFYREWPLHRQAEAWREAGIGNIGVRRMSLGGGVVIWGTVGG